MMYLFWAAIASALAVLAETLFRRGWDWGDNFWLFVPLAIALNFSIFRLVTAGPTLLVAIATFSLVTVVMRSAVSEFILGEPLRQGNLVAAAALAIGVLVGALWR
jgi:hypothetical protein